MKKNTKIAIVIISAIIAIGLVVSCIAGFLILPRFVKAGKRVAAIEAAKNTLSKNLQEGVDYTIKWVDAKVIVSEGTFYIVHVEMDVRSLNWPYTKRRMDNLVGVRFLENDYYWSTADICSKIPTEKEINEIRTRYEAWSRIQGEK
jgi:hypothetical protein